MTNELKTFPPMPLLKKLRVLIFLNCSVISEACLNKGGAPGFQGSWVPVGCMRDVTSNETQVLASDLPGSRRSSADVDLLLAS